MYFLQQGHTNSEGAINFPKSRLPVGDQVFTYVSLWGTVLIQTTYILKKNNDFRGMTSVPLDVLESLSHIHSMAFITQSWHPALNAKARTVEEASCHAGESRPTVPTAGGQCNSCKYDVQCSYRSIGGIADWTVLVLVLEQCEDDTWKNPLFAASPGVRCMIEKP